MGLSAVIGSPPVCRNSKMAARDGRESGENCDEMDTRLSLERQIRIRIRRLRNLQKIADVMTLSLHD